MSNAASIGGDPRGYGLEGGSWARCGKGDGKRQASFFPLPPSLEKRVSGGRMTRLVHLRTEPNKGC